jgi:CelD/BcsL family acetyltransferase involved in cellulose biosynthesis
MGGDIYPAKTLLRANNRNPSPDVRPVDVKVCTSLEAFAECQYDLHHFSARDNVEASIEWFDLLQKQVYPNDRGVRYYFVAENKTPSMILPLRLRTQRGVRTVESLSNYYTSLFAPLLTDENDLLPLRHMLTAAARDHGGTHVMRFAPMDPESRTYKALLDELRAINWIPFKFFCFGNWYLKVNDDWAGYLQKRSANFRRSIKRRNREFVEAGGTIEVVTTPLGVEQAIAAFQEVYSSSWKKPEPYPDFVPVLIRHLSANGMLRLGIARIHGKPIAAQLWIVAQNKASIYKLAYHETYARFSPGTVLTSHLMRHVIEQDHVSEVDFLTGDDKHKRVWMSDRRERWGIVAYNPRTMVGLALFAKEVSGRIARSVGKAIGSIVGRSQLIAAQSAEYFCELWKKHFLFRNASRNQSMTWTICPIAQLADFSRQWDALVQSRPGTPFLESAFLLPLVEVYGTGEERLCLLQSRTQLRAAAIMQRVRVGIWQTFQPSQLPLGAWVSDGSVDLLNECNVLINKLSTLTLGVGFSQLDSRVDARPADSPKVRTQDYIRTAWVDIEGSFEAYWEERGKNLRQNTRKQRNKLESEGIATRMECLVAAEDVAEAIEDYGVLEGSGWKAATGTAILSDNAQGRLYRKILENYCVMGRGLIYRYWFGDKVVAMDLCIHDHVALVILKTAYDESYKTVSPSTLMRQDQFQKLFEEHKFARIEFYGKVMEWHTRWTNQNRSIYHVTCYRWTWLNRLHARLSASSGGLSTEEPSSSSQD